ncbi:MAG: hypothetical protein GYA51_17165 [Candidatus Methanofastidiosa archaeon]|jgi:hypothetical protein|nr:hypothetical protein [Candidatus Methanofastidiosa archaeon]
MAIEKAKAIITSEARIFLLEIFLTALFSTPKNCHHIKGFGNREGAEEDACLTPQNPNGESMWLLYTGFYLLGCHEDP